MTLVAHSDLPAFSYLHDEGYEVLSPEEAGRQDIRELHIGLLNMMPDAALRATERQFFRLVGSCNRIVQICIHPFCVDTHARSAEAQDYIARYYADFETLKADGLDALIVTGANPAQNDITREPFWDPMIEVVEWARRNVTSILCSCLASHGLLKHFFGIERRRREAKCWGVYSHRVVDPSHPLVRHVNTRFDAPRSHVYEMTREQVESVGGVVLAHGDAGWHLATSPDGFRFVFLQGHPEYDPDSLLKEYKREMQRFSAGTRDLPPYPESYLSADALAVLEPHRQASIAARAEGKDAPEFPEPAVRPLLDNTWLDTGKGIFNNWLGLVYQRTHLDRRMPVVD